jgi:hypothetical protein
LQHDPFSLVVRVIVGDRTEEVLNGSSSPQKHQIQEIDLGTVEANKRNGQSEKREFWSSSDWRAGHAHPL